jgi:hypothetical protein
MEAEVTFLAHDWPAKFLWFTEVCSLKGGLATLSDTGTSRVTTALDPALSWELCGLC